MNEEIAVIEHEDLTPAPANLFGVSDPIEVIQRATSVASALKTVLGKQGLIQKIGEREHPKVEAWTLLGSMLGVFPVCVWTKPLENGWEARVEARTRTGEVVGAAEAECLRSEKRWSSADDYALRSMAQTRATSRALRQPLGFVMTLGGYDATPAEEMPAQSATEASEGITNAQMKLIAVLIKELEEQFPKAEGQLSYVGDLREKFHVKSRKDMTKQQASDAIEWLEGQKAPI